MTEDQQTFLLELESKFNNPQWSVSAWPKLQNHLLTQPLHRWQEFKNHLTDFATREKLIFSEREHFIFIGRNVPVIDYAEIQLTPEIKKIPGLLTPDCN